MTRREEIEKEAERFFDVNPDWDTTDLMVYMAEWADNNPVHYIMEDTAKKILVKVAQETAKLTADLETCVGALKFYAEGFKGGTIKSGGISLWDVPAERDSGKIAREALEKIGMIK